MTRVTTPSPEQGTGSTTPEPVPESLVALFERPSPEVAVPAPAWRGASVWSATLTRHRLLTAAVITPLLFWSYSGQIGRPLDLAWSAALTLISFLGALTLATYFPQRATATTAVSSPCASIAGLYVLFAGLALAGSPAGLGQGLLALGMVSFGLVQRLRGATACG